MENLTNTFNNFYRLSTLEAFRKGYEDARIGIPFDTYYYDSLTDIYAQASYENGRLLVAEARNLGRVPPKFRKIPNSKIVTISFSQYGFQKATRLPEYIKYFRSSLGVTVNPSALRKQKEKLKLSMA
jgi:hypothetical protein